MQSPKKTPPWKYLEKALSYNEATGDMTWRTRPFSHFTKEWVCQSWNTRYAGKPALASVGRQGYATGAIDGVIYQAHRIIWKLVTGNEPDTIDHINGVRSDNSWNNLRAVTWRDNYTNQRTARNNSSGTVGVYFIKPSGKWMARICVNRRVINLGTFVTPSEAAAARQAAEVHYGFHQNHGRK